MNKGVSKYLPNWNAEDAHLALMAATKMADNFHKAVVILEDLTVRFEGDPSVKWHNVLERVTPKWS